MQGPLPLHPKISHYYASSNILLLNYPPSSLPVKKRDLLSSQLSLRPIPPCQCLTSTPAGLNYVFSQGLHLEPFLFSLCLGSFVSYSHLFPFNKQTTPCKQQATATATKLSFSLLLSSGYHQLFFSCQSSFFVCLFFQKFNSSIKIFILIFPILLSCS